MEGLQYLLKMNSLNKNLSHTPITASTNDFPEWGVGELKIMKNLASNFLPICYYMYLYLFCLISPFTPTVKN